MAMIPSFSSLVKYETPVLISQKEEKKPPPPKGAAKEKITPAEQKAREQTEEILDSILPPREYEEDGQLWVQHVSSSPATRMDVINLQEQLDMKLLQRQARETGICAIRRELYDQCFDELIRQVTVNCAERGLLLLRVRDELRMTLAAYQTLYESSIAFGVRKALQAEQRKVETEQLVESMTSEKEELNNQVLELKQKFEIFEKKTAEQRQIDERKYNEEIQFLKRTNQQLKAQLEGIIAPKK